MLVKAAVSSLRKDITLGLFVLIVIKGIKGMTRKATDIMNDWQIRRNWNNDEP